MFDKLFQFIREGVKNAILGGVQDAHAELVSKVEANEPLVIEGHTNGKATTKRKAVKR